MSTFTWWFFNLGVAFFWLAIAVKSESWFMALGGVVYLVIAMLIDLPGTSSAETWEDDDDGWPLG